MIEINWHVFSEKFKDSVAYKFEFLAYCLFSYEFNIQNGLFRYKNHPGIETAPIELHNGIAAPIINGEEMQINQYQPSHHTRIVLNR